MASLTCEPCMQPHSLFPKLVAHRRISRMTRAERKGLGKGGMSQLQNTVKEVKGREQGKRRAQKGTRKTILGKVETSSGQGGMRNWDCLSSLVNHIPGLHLRNLIVNLNIYLSSLACQWPRILSDSVKCPLALP